MKNFSYWLWLVWLPSWWMGLWGWLTAYRPRRCFWRLVWRRRWLRRPYTWRR